MYNFSNEGQEGHYFSDEGQQGFFLIKGQAGWDTLLKQSA